ncbi:MAG: hypothetical protein VX768_02165 [Planctomycetota bacterium]|nr:hypothetical protein [Planctomycetota bacterium]
MKIKNLFFTSATVCTACLAILLSQSLFSGLANASPSLPSKNNFNLRQRVEDLERAQEENDKEFFLIDTSLSDLDMRVMDLEKRAGARAGRVNEISKRLAALRASLRD